ncbi:MAG: response regulator [Cyanobacteriota bacterium]|nr:response regulator [Cyanobacteriota bacterium]
MATVLVVEDSASEAAIITSCLQKGGLIPIIVGSSEEARQRLEQQKPDLIVLDVVLPGSSGFEFCRELRKKPETAHLPIVICSTKDGDMDKFWGMKQGASAYITKPINQEELLRTVQALIKA